MKKVTLHGELGKIFKSVWFLHVKTPCEAVNALMANEPEIKYFLSKKEQEGISYAVGYEKEKPLIDKAEYDCFSDKDLHVFPVPAGGMAMAGQLLMTGAQQYASSFLNAKIERWKQKKLDKLNQADDGSPIIIQTKSYLAGGKDNRFQQGSIVPLGYGRMKLGSNVVSACNLNYEYDSVTNRIKNYAGGAIAGLAPTYMDNVYSFTSLSQSTSIGDSVIYVDSVKEFSPGDDVEIDGVLRYVTQVVGNSLLLNSPLTERTFNEGTRVKNIDDPIIRSLDFDGAGPLGYEAPGRNHRADGSLRFGAADSIYGDVLPASVQARDSVTARYGDDWGGYLYYKYNWGKGIDKDKINMDYQGNWRPIGLRTRSANGGFIKPYVLGYDALNSSYVGLQSMPRQETSDDNLDPETKRFYPIIYNDGIGGATEVGQRWKQGRKVKGVGWYKLESVSIYKSIDLVCEGPIEGFCDRNGTTIEYRRGSSNDDFLQGVFLNDTPVKEKSNTMGNEYGSSVFYNVNEFDIDVASNDDVIGAGDQSLLKDHYLFTAHTKEVNQKLYGPRKANPADMIQGYTRTVFTDNTQLFKHGQFLEWTGVDYIDDNDDGITEGSVNVKRVGKFDGIINSNDLTTGDYRAIEKYELGGGGTKGYGDPKYNQYLYPGDDSFEGLIVTYDKGRYFTPYIGWDDDRPETINDYQYFSGEYVDLAAGKKYTAGTKVRTLADDGTINYVRMGANADKFLGIYSDFEISRYSGKVGYVVMAPTKNQAQGIATTNNSLYLITGSISAEGKFQEQYGDRLTSFALQIIALNPDVDDTMSTDPWFICTRGREAINKTVVTEQLDRIKGNGSLRYIDTIFSSSKDDVTPSASPQLWDEVMIENPDHAWVRAHPDTPGATQKKSNEIDYIATMFGQTIEEREIEEAEADRDPEAWREIVNDQNDLKKHKILGALENSKTLDRFKIKRHNRVALVDAGPLADVAEGINVPRYNLERFFDLNKTGNFPYSKIQNAKLYEVNGTVRSDYAQSDKVIYVKIDEDPNSHLPEDRTSTGDANKGFYATMTFRTTGNDEYTWEKEDREIENYRIFNKTFITNKETGATRTEIVKEIVLKDPLSKIPAGGSSFKIVYKYKSSVKYTDKTTSQGFDVLEITDTVVAASGRNPNRKTLYFKLQKRVRDPRHDFIALWVDAYDLTSVYNFTKLVNASEDHADDFHHYVNVAHLMFTRLSSSNLRLTIKKEEEFFVNHTIINPLVDRVYVGLQINELYYTYAGDEVEITYKIGKMMALIFSIMIAINAAGIVGSFGIGYGFGIVAVNNFGWLLFLAVVALVVGWIVYIGLRNAQFKIGNRIDNSGELWPNRAKFRIKYGNIGEPMWTTDVYLYGVCTDGYRKDVKIFLPPNPKNKDRVIKVFKLNRERNPVIEGEQAARYKNDFSVYAFTEIIPTKLNYANSVVIGTRINGRDMGGSLPVRNYHLKLKRVPIPSNYDPELRKYTGGWDGLFKGQLVMDDLILDEYKDWTDNPAWCLYDLISNKTYGAGKFGIQFDHIDRWTLYKIAKYCDEFVPTGYSPKYKKKRFVVSSAGDASLVMKKSDFNGDEDFLDQFGARNANVAVFYDDDTYDCLKVADYRTDYTHHDGQENYQVSFVGGFGVEKDGECALEIDYPLVEPRHTINAILMEEQNAYTLINEFAEIFRSYTYWADGRIKFFQDEKKEPLMLFNNTNVSEDGFSYSNMPKTNRVNISKVRYLDKYESYKPKLEMSQDREAINNNNVIEETREGFGITSKSQAKRLTEFSLKSANLETEMVSFKTSLIGSYLRPGDVFQVLDSNRTIGRYAGKITNSKIDENSRFLYLYLDYPVDCDINPHDNTSWKDITIYDLSEFETIEALNLENKSKIEDERIDNLRKSQLGKVKAIDISQGKEKITIVDNTYEYIDGEFTFKTAVEDAINRGGEIACIGSELDQYLAYLAFPKVPGKNAWIGGYIHQNGTYIWHAPKHDDPAIKYFNWKPGFPKEAAGDLSDLGLEDEPSYENYGNYISMYASETNTYHGKWILNRGDLKQGYILERKSSNDKSSIFRFKNLKNKSFMIEDEVNMANAKTYSVLSMQEESNGVFKITAKEYNKDKFDNIEKNLSIENPYTPVIWTDQIISDHTVDSYVEVESIEQEDETFKHYLVASWNTIQPSGYFRITYFNGVEKISSFEIVRVPNLENAYTHRIYLPEYTGKELFRVEVYLVN